MSFDRIKDFAAIREGAAIGAVAPRAAIAVAGQDRASYLQGLLTNDIQALQPGEGCYSAWLTAQGRMITDLHVLQSDGLLLLDVPAALVDGLLQRLDQFVFTEDVQLQSLADSLASVWLHGAQAARVLGQAVHGATPLDAWPSYHHERLDFGGSPVVIARIDQLGVPGYCAYVEVSRRDAFVTVLERAGASPVGAEAIDAARIENGYPVFGLDMTEDTIPLEAGIESRAISFTKGCYVGQEIVIRVLHRGGGRVARRLVGLRADGPLRRDAKVFAGEREVGTITSAGESPRLGSIALGYVHRDFTAPSTPVEVDVEGQRRGAIVSALPFASVS